ncbi:gamma-glutamylcyclotransferase [Paractinoplanes deccanensis]|uniref:Gamma-glutamylcyclotransferase n=1 Tax=Paractinoplanes deccanensis TaxID=113561 RepID=A0ABQ3Y8H5_9ACTN|nr:gamma-glutamylcyclotransferase [Actinoplanes deccanensis]GID76307.1 gamma-glutamylcyclotransferase [Actinoplanes deccanensis]
MRHYAAYGSNLDPARMRAYCPHSPMVGVGWIEGWRLTFAGEGEMGWEGAVTTIVESPGDRVFVSLYDVHPWDAAQLDEVEGVTAGAYQKLTVRVSTLEGEFSAWVYVFDGYEGGMPTAWYLSEIANAAEKAGAPDDYVEELRRRPTRTSSPEQ